MSVFSGKTWKNRVSQYPYRRILTDTDGNETQVIITRDEGTVTTAGDAFTADSMNDLETRIATAVNSKMEPGDLVTDYDEAAAATAAGEAPDCLVIAEVKTKLEEKLDTANVVSTYAEAIAKEEAGTVPDSLVIGEIDAKLADTLDSADIVSTYAEAAAKTDAGTVPDSLVIGEIDTKLEGKFETENVISDYDTVIATTEAGTAPDCTVIAQLVSNFRDGCDLIADALTEAGIDTAEGATPEEIAAAIAELGSTNSSDSGGASSDDLDDGLDDPSDTHTHLHILVGPNGTATIYLTVTGTSCSNEVDWGDGTSEVYEGNGYIKPSHEYSNTDATIYDVTITPDENVTDLSLGRGVSSNPLVTEGTLIKAFVGDDASALSYAFQYCYNLLYADFGGSDAVNQGACYSGASLQQVVIPDGVTTIGSSAFYYCYALESVDIPDGVTSIGTNAFAYCYALASLTIPGTVTSIGNAAFTHCHAFTSIIIPDSVTSISNNAFSYCYNLRSLSGLYITSDVTGTGVFTQCYRLTDLTDVRYIGTSISFTSSPLSYDSVINVFNALDSENVGTVTLSSESYSLLSDTDLAIATDKGWTVASA